MNLLDQDRLEFRDFVDMCHAADQYHKEARKDEHH